MKALQNSPSFILKTSFQRLLKDNYSCFLVITLASVYGKPESENATDFLAKRGVMVPGIPCIDCGNWGRERDIARSCQNSVFWEESFGKYRSLHIHLAHKDADLFPKGSVLELYS